MRKGKLIRKGGGRKMGKIFQKVNDTPKEASKFIGFHLDEELDESFTLLTLSSGKSSLLRSLVKKWVKSQRKPITVVTERAFLLWKLGEGSPYVFKKELKEDLKSKGISGETIGMIIRGFDILVLEDK